MGRSHVVITGGSGFVGTALTTLFVENGWRVTVLDLYAPEHSDDVAQHVSFFKTDLTENVPAAPLQSADAVVNLAGKNIFTRFTDDAKTAIRSSRIQTTRNLVTALQDVDEKPDVLVSASATGIYGDHGENIIFEDAGHGDSFLAQVCEDWETETRKAEQLDMREVRIRTAPVLGPGGGMLNVLLPFFKYGLGGTIGSGTFYMPWIHRQDLVNVYYTAVTGDLSGAVNAAAPNPVTNKAFTHTLGDVLNRPTLLRIPKIGLRLLYKDLAEEITMSQNVHPQKLLEHGFTFTYPELEDALAAAINNNT